ncbi:MAG: hypothetical protein ACEPOW_14660 [Bacteroidales bacterium]
MDIEIFMNALINLAPLILATTGALLASIKLFELKKVRKSSKDSIYNTLDQKLESGLINDKEDIQLIINSFSRTEDEFYSITPVLEDYFTKRLSKSDKIETEELKRRYKLIKDIIKDENKNKPFSEVPDEERRLLISIKDALSNNDNQAIEFNVNELNSVLSTRNKVYEKTNRLNKWSVPLAIAGTFFTILFGILSLSPQGVDYDRIKDDNNKIIKDQFEKYKNEIDTWPNKKYSAFGE